MMNISRQRYLAILFVAIGASTVTAQDAPVLAETESNTHCIVRLSIPRYPKLAELARLSSSVTAIIGLARNGSVRNLKLDVTEASATTKRSFESAVEGAIRASVFRKDCSGKTVTLVFYFVLSEELNQGSSSQEVSFGYPNRFWISVPPKVIQGELEPWRIPQSDDSGFVPSVGVSSR